MTVSPYEEELEASASEHIDGGSASLHRQVLSSFGWSFVNSIIGRVATVLMGLVLARLLVPADYGVFAVALLVLTLLQSMNELGVSVAVVRWGSDVSRAARSATTLAIGTSGLLYAGLFGVAPFVARAVSAPQASAVIRVLSLGILIDSVSSIPGALLARSFLQGKRAVADLAALVPTVVISVGLAATGFGVWSLVVGTLAGNVTATALILAFAPERPRPGWNAEDAHHLLRVGLPLAGTSLALLSTLNVDYLVVGRILGTTDLGLYLLAFNLSSWPATLLSVAVRRVAIPGFAQVAQSRGGPAALQRAFRRSLSALATPALTAAMLLATLSHPLIQVVYGRRWLPAASALELLAVLGGLRVLFDLSYDVLAAIGRARMLLAVQLAWLVALVVALPISAHRGGIHGVGLGHCLVALGIVSPLYLLALRRAGITVAQVVGGLVWPVLGAVVGGVIAVAGRHYWNVDPALQLVVVGSVSGMVSLAIGASAPDHRGMRARVWRQVLKGPSSISRRWAETR